MAELSVPQVNFSALGELPGIYKQGQADALRQQTLANLGQGGQVDANTLLRSGDLSLAQLGINLRNRQEEQARQAQLDERQAARDKVTDSHWASDYALRKATNDRGGDDKFVVKEVTDPNTGQTSFVRIKTTGTEGPISAGAAPPSAPANPFAYPGAKPQTESQSKDSGYANRMFDAEKVLRDPNVIAAGQSYPQAAIEGVPLVPDALKNWAHSPEYQRYDQAQRNMINAILRRESGAAISQSEFDNAYKQYIPRPGDSAEKLAEKQRNRQAAIAGIAGGGGPNYRPQYSFGAAGELVPTGAPAQGASGGTSPAPPKVGQLMDGYRYKGGNPADPNSWVKSQ